MAIEGEYLPPAEEAEPIKIKEGTYRLCGQWMLPPGIDYVIDFSGKVIDCRSHEYEVRPRCISCKHCGEILGR